MSEIGLWKYLMNSIFKKVENILKNAAIEEYKAEAKMIITEISGLSVEEIILHNKILNEEEIIKTAIKRVFSKAPIQYILGCCYFMDEKYKVNEDVLVPRDETQILVEEAYNLIKDKINKIKILDIGTGTGCISCSLAKKLINKDIEILAVDISLGALEVAMENIKNLNLIRKVAIRKSDIFSKIHDFEKFDLIISNPPYIPISDKNSLDDIVKNFEPDIALFADDKDGIEFYKKIIQNAKNHLKENGFLAFELGINQALIVKKMFLENDFKNIKITKDLSNIDRVITAQKIN